MYGLIRARKLFIEGVLDGIIVGERVIAGVQQGLTSAHRDPRLSP